MIRFLRILLCSSWLAACVAQAAAVATSAVKTTETEEVLVNGERMKLEAMRKEIVQLEDRFYDRYNELNTVDDFDIRCIEEARTGTRFIKRSCRPVYQERAVQEEGQAAFKIQQRFREKGPQLADSGPPVPATQTILRRLPEYKKNMEEVTRQDPELARLLERRGRLIEQYNSALKKNWGLAPPPDDDLIP
jgi:hypothetical protein